MELKPCAHCGNDDIEGPLGTQIGWHKYYEAIVECACGSSMSNHGSSIKDVMEGVKQKWNRRAEPVVSKMESAEGEMTIEEIDKLIDGLISDALLLGSNLRGNPRPDFRGIDSGKDNLIKAIKQYKGSQKPTE
jgi:hypothetical protein